MIMPVSTRSDSPVRMTVLMPSSDFEAFDAYCHEKGFKKSTLVRRLISEHLAQVGYQLQGKLPLGRPGSEEDERS